MSLYLKFSEGALLSLILLVFGVAELKSEPYISFQTKLQCSVCHVNPTGGGMRTAFGRSYGNKQLPSSAQNLSDTDIAKIAGFLTLGGDLRYNFNSAESDANSTRENTFAVDSGQIYLLISPGIEGLSLYLDQQVAPGAAQNREAFIIKQFENGNYLKVGKMMPVLGLKLEDDSAFTRRVTGFNFDNSDNGIEYGIQGNGSVHTLFITNGTNSVSNDDNKFQLGGRSEFFVGNARFGGALVYNDSDVSDRQIISVFGGYTFGNITLLGEVTQVQQEAVVEGGLDLDQQIGLIEANWRISTGHNLKLTEEYHDPDIDLDEDHRVRHSVVYEYTPFSHLQLRFGLRIQNSPPQNPQDDIDTLFIQTHFYF